MLFCLWNFVVRFYWLHVSDIREIRLSFVLIMRTFTVLSFTPRQTAIGYVWQCFLSKKVPALKGKNR